MRTGQWDFLKELKERPISFFEKATIGFAGMHGPCGQKSTWSVLKLESNRETFIG